MRSTTIKDVARLAGVSAATASRVLSGHSATSEDARQAVRDAAAELGFRPNAQARSLRKTSTQTIGLLLPDIRNPFFADLAHAVEQRAREFQYLTLFGNANESQEQQERYLDVMLSQRVDGLIAAPQGEARSLVGLLAGEVPTVFVDRVVDGAKVPSVTADNGSGIADAVRHLTELGHRRIGYIAGPQSTSTGRERLQAYRGAVAETGADDDGDLVFLGDFQSASGAAGARRLLDLPAPPTALLAADSLMSIGAVGVCNERGLAIGADLAFVAYDDIEAFTLLNPALTVITHDVHAMGRLAVDLLLAEIAGESPASVVLPSRLIIRGSTPPLPGGTPA
ncbi:LacI family DNA-binding transcriptional regulator [Arthrobacter sp. zg-Y1219]|uniref:LacI family DNA-binding transcriptional regulator n=1 Tax=Arthrobacter sp. zg-Y1219 TaxID=3049067 RepID=UPI0024C2845F|nr:LacI family DNA-binding transcriptional regulator [Arthrobacter sp. zg-Y1219]MDK1360086.1 LacI family DNA-binding transcriptional regulator [Arthrobacter sp. zg-Y1219]